MNYNASTVFLLQRYAQCNQKSSTSNLIYDNDVKTLISLLGQNEIQDLYFVFHLQRSCKLIHQGKWLRVFNYPNISHQNKINWEEGTFVYSIHNHISTSFFFCSAKVCTYFSNRGALGMTHITAELLVFNPKHQHFFFINFDLICQIKSLTFYCVLRNRLILAYL